MNLAGLTFQLQSATSVFSTLEVSVYSSSSLLLFFLQNVSSNTTKDACQCFFFFFFVLRFSYYYFFSHDLSHAILGKFIYIYIYIYVCVYIYIYIYFNSFLIFNFLIFLLSVYLI